MLSAPNGDDDDALLLVTTDGIAGHEIDEVLGFVAGFASDRDSALRLLERQARDRGANAVVAIRLDSSASGGAFVSNEQAFAYGTAVRAHRRMGSPAR